MFEKGYPMPVEATDDRLAAEGQKREKKEKVKEYDPIKVLRERDMDPECIYTDENGKDVIDDEDLNFLFKFVRQNVKEGSVLNLGGGFSHAHYMSTVADKITHATSIEISPKNNQVTEELLKSIADKKFKGELVKKLDTKTLTTLAGALSGDSSYGIEKSKQEMLAMLSEKCQYNGHPDVITADMIEGMHQLGSGEMVDGRKYDNILMLFASYTRSKEETLEFFKNVKMRLNDSGWFTIVDVADYSGLEDPKEDNVILQEDKIVAEKYPTPWVMNIKDVEEILKEAGFKNIIADEKEVNGEAEKDEFGKYLVFRAEI